MRGGVAGDIVTSRRKRRCNGVDFGVEGEKCFLGDETGEAPGSLFSLDARGGSGGRDVDSLAVTGKMTPIL